MTDESAWSERMAESAARVDLGPLKAAHGVGDVTDESPRTDTSELLRELHAQPCQHYWLQYMRCVERGDITGYTYHLAPVGYFCVHCPARSDEARVITNPEAL